MDTLLEVTARTLYELDFYPDIPEDSFDSLEPWVQEDERIRAQRLLDTLQAHGFISTD